MRDQCNGIIDGCIALTTMVCQAMIQCRPIIRWRASLRFMGRGHCRYRKLVALMPKHRIVKVQRPIVPHDGPWRLMTSRKSTRIIYIPTMDDRRHGGRIQGVFYCDLGLDEGGGSSLGGSRNSDIIGDRQMTKQEKFLLIRGIIFIFGIVLIAYGLGDKLDRG